MAKRLLFQLWRIASWSVLVYSFKLEQMWISLLRCDLFSKEKLYTMSGVTTTRSRSIFLGWHASAFNIKYVLKWGNCLVTDSGVHFSYMHDSTTDQTWIRKCVFLSSLTVQNRLIPIRICRLFVVDSLPLPNNLFDSNYADTVSIILLCSFRTVGHLFISLLIMAAQRVSLHSFKVRPMWTSLPRYSLLHVTCSRTFNLINTISRILWWTNECKNSGRKTTADFLWLNEKYFFFRVGNTKREMINLAWNSHMRGLLDKILTFTCPVFLSKHETLILILPIVTVNLLSSTSQGCTHLLFKSILVWCAS